MREVLFQSYRILVAIGIIVSFVIGISFLPFSQTKTFHRISKSSNSFSAYKSLVNGTEYNLNSFLNTTEDFRFNESRENTDYLHLLTFLLPHDHAFHQYYKKNNFHHNQFAFLNYKLHSIPPPCCS
jgi:hypothetical protein